VRGRALPAAHAAEPAREGLGGDGLRARAPRYLVNLKHAVELRAQLNGTAVLIMRDDTEIPVARRNVAALRRRLHA
jgi:hypothetical protein